MSDDTQWLDEPDDRYPLEWLIEAPEPLDSGDELDPRHPEFLEPWRPSSAEDALIKELAHQYVTRRPEFNAAFLRYCTAHYRDRTFPQGMLALFALLDTTAVSAQGYGLAVRRLAEDLKVAREIAAEEAS